MIEARDERPHRAGTTSAWTETWEFRLVVPDLSAVVAAAITRRPAENSASFYGMVCGRGRPSVVVVDHEIALPRWGLELRGSGIWADHVCESPLVHWSLGLEAFGLALDGPDDLVITGRGLPTPLGWELEWETPDGPASADPPGERGYVAAGWAHGEVLVGDETLEVEGPGHRLHRWGTGLPLTPWWCGGAHAGVGPPPRKLDAGGRVRVADHTGSMTDLSFGVLPTADGPGRPGWVSGLG